MTEDDQSSVSPAASQRLPGRRRRSPEPENSVISKAVIRRTRHRWGPLPDVPRDDYWGWSPPGAPRDDAEEPMEFGWELGWLAAIEVARDLVTRVTGVAPSLTGAHLLGRGELDAETYYGFAGSLSGTGLFTQKGEDVTELGGVLLGELPYHNTIKDGDSLWGLDRQSAEQMRPENIRNTTKTLLELVFGAVTSYRARPRTAVILDDLIHPRDQTVWKLLDDGAIGGMTQRYFPKYWRALGLPRLSTAPGDPPFPARSLYGVAYDRLERELDLRDDGGATYIHWFLHRADLIDALVDRLLATAGLPNPTKRQRAEVHAAVAEPLADLVRRIDMSREDAISDFHASVSGPLTQAVHKIVRTIDPSAPGIYDDESEGVAEQAIGAAVAVAQRLALGRRA